MRKLFKKNKGITLIALIITIIVLLILAGVTINAIIGNESAMDKAKQAKNETEIAHAKDAASLRATTYIQEFMEKKYVQNDSSVQNVQNAGDYVATQMHNKTEGEFTFSVSIRVLTVKKGTTNIVSGNIENDGRITWNTDVNNNEEDDDTAVSSNPIIFTYNVLTTSTASKVDGVEEREKVADNTGNIKVGDTSTRGTVEITGFDGQKIFDSYKEYAESNGYEFGDMFDNFFKDMAYVKINDDEYKLVIPSKVKLSLKDGSYYYDENGIEYDVTSIGDNAFSDYDGVLRTYYYDENSGGVQEWLYMSPPSEIVMPNSITSVGDGAFSGFGGIINVPTNLAHIGDWAISGYCKNITIPATTSDVGENAIACSGVETISAPFGLFEESFGENRYNIDFNYEGTVEVKLVGDVFGGEYLYLLLCAYELDDTTTGEFTLPSGIKTISDYSGFENLFKYAPGDYNILNIPEGVTTIGRTAFYDCSEYGNLKIIKIPSTVTSLWYDTFSNYDVYLESYEEQGETDKFITIEYGGTRAQWNAINILNEDGNSYPLDLRYITVHCSDDT